MKKLIKAGYEIEIREAVVEDAQAMVDYMKIVNSESKNLSREPHEWNMTVDEERSIVKAAQESNNSCFIVCYKDGELISSAGFSGRGLMRLSHRVSLGISVLSKYNNQGIGSLMMDEVIRVAKSYHKTKIELDVRCDNIAAIHLYEKYGFTIEGFRADGFFVDDTYIGLTLMGLNLREEL